MKIEAITGPSIIPISTTNTTEYKAAAIAKLQGLMNANNQAPTSTAQEHPVQDPSHVSAEEMSALNGSKHSIEEPKTEESKPVEDTPITDEALSSQYAVLARRDKQLRQRERALQAREAELKKLSAPAPEPTRTFDESKYISKDRLSSDPITALLELGLNQDQIANMLLNQQDPGKAAQDVYMRKMEAKIQELENKQDKVNKTFEEREVENRKQAVRQLEADAKRLVFTDPAYETIKETGSVKEVVELIERTFDETGLLLSVEEAAQEVENEISERLFRYTSKINKVKSRLQTVAPSSAKSQDKPVQSQPQMKTLTNAAGSTGQLSARQRAMLAFKNELK